MKNTIVTGFQSLLVMTFLALFFSGSAIAASACKGLSKSKCNANGSCSWVEKYTTKKGTSVGPFCRSKPGKASSKGAAASSKAKKSVDTKKKAVSKKKSTGKTKKATEKKKKVVEKKKATKKKVKEKN